jgi:predicted nucleotidyltransferase
VVDESIVKAVQQYLHDLQQRGLPVHAGILFGSWARGAGHRWSDIDVLVVSPRFDEDIQRSDVDLLWHVAARTDTRIEPVPCGVRQWTEDDSSPIVEIARREGCAIDTLVREQAILSPKILEM